MMNMNILRTGDSPAIATNRREFLAGIGLGISGLAAGVVLLGQDGSTVVPVQIDPSSGLYPVLRNDIYKIDRALTAESVNARWNNFYEFGSHRETLSSKEWRALLGAA